MFLDFSEELKPYLRYSAALHVLFLLILARILVGKSIKETPVYTIDFVGVTQVEAAAEVRSEAHAAAVLARERTSEGSPEFSRRRAHEALPPPSLLQGFVSKPQQAQAAPTSPIHETQAPPSSGQATLSMDMPNFPFPWYISQIRMALWNKWSARMGAFSGNCVVGFSILAEGQAVDLRVEESSGDENFDLAALGTVKDAAPFPPLPQGFKEPFLKIHLALKSGI